MTEKDNDFDFQSALKAVQKEQPLLGIKGIFTPLIKNLTESALEPELDSHLGQEVVRNRRNGKSKKNIKSLNGSFGAASRTFRAPKLAHLSGQQCIYKCIYKYKFDAAPR